MAWNGEGWSAGSAGHQVGWKGGAHHPDQHSWNQTGASSTNAAAPAPGPSAMDVQEALKVLAAAQASGALAEVVPGGANAGTKGNSNAGGKGNKGANPAWNKNGQSDKNGPSKGAFHSAGTKGGGMLKGAGSKSNSFDHAAPGPGSNSNSSSVSKNKSHQSSVGKGEKFSGSKNPHLLGQSSAPVGAPGATTHKGHHQAAPGATTHKGGKGHQGSSAASAYFPPSSDHNYAHGDGGGPTSTHGSTAAPPTNKGSKGKGRGNNPYVHVGGAQSALPLQSGGKQPNSTSARPGPYSTTSRGGDHFKGGDRLGIQGQVPRYQVPRVDETRRAFEEGEVDTARLHNMHYNFHQSSEHKWQVANGQQNPDHRVSRPPRPASRQGQKSDLDTSKKKPGSFSLFVQQQGGEKVFARPSERKNERKTPTARGGGSSAGRGFRVGDVRSGTRGKTANSPRHPSELTSTETRAHEQEETGTESKAQKMSPGGHDDVGITNKGSIERADEGNQKASEEEADADAGQDSRGGGGCAYELPEHWVEYEVDGHTAFFNKKTRETQWTRPEAAKLPPGWIRYSTGDGQTAYYHEELNLSQWEMPGEEECNLPGGAVEGEGGNEGNENEDGEGDGSRSGEEPAAPEGEDEDALAGGPSGEMEVDAPPA
eukprot:g15449.t1